jgi:type IV pilus assembly protein PilO
MTYADEEFIPVEGQDENPSYPTAFGITFTPRVGGIIIGVLGLLGATYLLLNVVQPAWQKYQELDTDIKTKQAQLKRQEEIKQEMAQANIELEQAKQRNKQVLTLFSNERTLDTLLLDLNSFIKARNGTLTYFEPVKQTAQAANSNLAEPIPGNGKLARKIYNIRLDGTFDQTQSILRSYERLQSLLLVKDYKSELYDDQGVVINVNNGTSVPAIFKKDDNRKPIPGGKPTIRTSFKLEALIPVTEDQAKQADSQPAQKAKK